jgi:hypothetical protein
MNKERAEPRVRRVDITQTEASIDQNKSLVCLDEQTVADEASRQTPTEAIEECPTDWAHAATIEMMNVHNYSTLNSYLTAPRLESHRLLLFRYQTVSTNCALSTFTEKTGFKASPL